MTVLKSEQIMRAELEHRARSVMDLIGDCYSIYFKTYAIRSNSFDFVDNFLTILF